MDTLAAKLKAAVIFRENIMDRIIITNAKVILPDGIKDGYSVVVSGGKIEDIVKGNAGANLPVYDAKGMYLSPGFVDIHLHGGGGYDFMDGTVEGYRQIVFSHRAHGTTALLPTTLGSSYEEILRAINVYKQAKKQADIADSLLGIHLEGPYISKNQAGAQPPKYIREPHIEEYRPIIEAGEGDIVRWSGAPELEGMADFAKFMLKNNVMMSIAHSDAEYDEVLKGFEQGFRHITHLYSAISTIKRVAGFRVAGVLESAYLIDGMDVEIIADGCHLPESLLRYVCKFKDHARIALVTDAMRASGQDVKESYLGTYEQGVRAIIEDGVAKLPDRTAFAGSIATTDRLVRNMVQKAGLTLHQAVKMMTANPVRMLNRNFKKGSIIKGYDADLVIFDDDINVKKVYVKGKAVFGE